MRFEEPLIPGRLVRRYKRFLADVDLDCGTRITAHTANPGRMLGLTEPGRRVYLSRSKDERRKLPYTWEVLRIGRSLIGVNPIRANALVAEALARGRIPELASYAVQRREVPYGERSRVDFKLEEPRLLQLPSECYLEVKNVSYLLEGGAQFPDAPTERGRRHLRELREVVRGGGRAVLLFVVQRPEPEWVGPADSIDPDYAQLLREVAADGVELLAYRAKVGTRTLRLTDSIPLRL